MKWFRFINYWTSLSSWVHVYYQMKACTEANINEDYWDIWR